MTAKADDAIKTSKKYNERYSRPVTMQLGDLETLQLALAAADDYLLWLVDLRGQKHGAVEVVQRSVKSARALAYELRGPQGEIPIGDYEQAVGASEPKGSNRESPAPIQDETTGEPAAWIEVREGMTLGEIGRLIDVEFAKRRTEKATAPLGTIHASHCNFGFTGICICK